MTQTITVYSDIDLDLEVQQDGDITRDTDEEAIMNSVRNCILTIQGERRMLPEFATTIQKMLFENMTPETEQLIKFKIVDVLNRWEPRIDIVQLYTKADYDANQYDCFFEFNIKGFPEKITSANFIIRRI